MVVTVGAALVLTSCGFIVPIKPQPMAQVTVTVVTPVSPSTDPYLQDCKGAQCIAPTTVTTLVPPTIPKGPKRSGPDFVVGPGADPNQLTDYCRSASDLANLAYRLDQSTSSGDMQGVPAQIRSMTARFAELMRFQETKDRAAIRTVIAAANTVAAKIERSTDDAENLRTFQAFATRMAPQARVLMNDAKIACG